MVLPIWGAVLIAAALVCLFIGVIVLYHRAKRLKKIIIELEGMYEEDEQDTGGGIRT